jgi:hypothetical protein
MVWVVGVVHEKFEFLKKKAVSKCSVAKINIKALRGSLQDLQSQSKLVVPLEYLLYLWCGVVLCLQGRYDDINVGVTMDDYLMQNAFSVSM